VQIHPDVHHDRASFLSLARGGRYVNALSTGAEARSFMASRPALPVAALVPAAPRHQDAGRPCACGGAAFCQAGIGACRLATNPDARSRSAWSVSPCRALSAGPLLAAGPRFRLHILIGSPPPSRRCNPLASCPLSLTHGERWVGAVSRPAPYGPTSPRRRDRRHSQARPAARILRRFRTGAAPGAVRTRRRPRCEAEAFSSSSW
jgi:hypothetical protein